LQLEQAIRNYDPCISCATHFLDLTVERVQDAFNLASSREDGALKVSLTF